MVQPHTGVAQYARPPIAWGSPLGSMMAGKSGTLSFFRQFDGPQNGPENDSEGGGKGLPNFL